MYPRKGRVGPPVTPTVDVIGITTAVVVLVQMVKWACGDWTRDRELLLVFGVSLAVLALWVVSSQTFVLAALWVYFLTWLTVSTSAAGVYGFVRSGPWSSPSDVPPTISSNPPGAKTIRLPAAEVVVSPAHADVVSQPSTVDTGPNVSHGPREDELPLRP
jgi:hypothetical protein